MLSVTPAFSSSDPSSLALFDRVWETVDRNFYDPQFNGVDWQALRKKYRSQIAASTLEGKGVQPEIEVPFPLPYARGVDPQTERAIEVALAAANTAKH